MTGQAFSEVENTDPEVHKKWLQKHGFEPDEDGKFSVDSFEGRSPVEIEALLDNIKINSARGLEALQISPYDERTFVMICGGPSLEDHLDEIKRKVSHPERYLVVCSNLTGKYLLDNGIVPHVHFIIDPQPRKKFDIAVGSTHPDVEYWINASCDPKVFDTLEAQGIKPKIFLADFESEGKAVKLMHDTMRKDPKFQGFMAIQGGTMAGLRAINLADARGFRSMQYYGFDATVVVKDGKARPYAYEKRRGEAIIEIECDRCGEKFPTTLVFQRQVNEFIQWRHNMPWLNIKIIGGGLISHYNQHLINEEPDRVTYRYTPNYIGLQKELHEVGDYGVSGIENSPTIFHAVSQLAKRLKKVHVLDYGSARGHTVAKVKSEFWLPPTVTFSCYDPAIDNLSDEPAPADLLICTDVLEHVEPECTWAVLDHIQSLTRCIVFFAISLIPASKTMSDGRNAHINLRKSEFWMREIQKRFIISEAHESKDGSELLVVAQSVADVRAVMRDRAQVKELAENPDLVIT